MNQQADIEKYDFLWKLLANPADNNHVAELRSLISDFPQSGVLRALLAANNQNGNLNHAAAYFDPAALYQLTTASDGLPIVNASQVISRNEIPVTAEEHYEHETSSFVPLVEEFSGTDDNAATENEVVVDDHQETIYTFSEQGDEADIYTYAEDDNAIAHTDNLIHEDAPVINTDEILTEDIIAEDGAPLLAELANDENTEVKTPPAIHENTAAKEYEEYMSKSAGPLHKIEGDEYFHQDIDDEVYDEIVGIEDIGLNHKISTDHTETLSESETTINTEAPDNNEQSHYFVFDNGDAKSFDETEEPVNKEVSRYNDEKMPYTFMWWLDKTRREHASMHQPYVSNRPLFINPTKEEIADELQQQYYENILNLNSVDELDHVEPKPDTPPPARKEDKIIERFIQEEPQIKHPSGVKLDNENKAKKSSEDQGELVTETLARIYTEQMLYHKAIATYKKLMLKFPEKSLYFAGQIEQLESKIN